MRITRRDALLGGTAALLSAPMKRVEATLLMDDQLFSVAAVAACDPYFGYVKLLAGFEGANASTGAPGYTDESPAAHGTATNVGNAQIDTSQFKFGASSFKCGTTGGMFFPDSPDWTLSSSNSDQFTIECSVRSTAFAISQIFVCQSFTTVGTSSWIFGTAAGSASELQFAASSTGGSFNILPVSSGAALAPNTWYQVAVDKDSTGKIRLYRDGVMVGSQTPVNSAIQDTSRRLGIGCNDNSTPSFTTGWVDEIRITKGVARYASDSGYTPATTAFPRVGTGCAVACDLYYSNTVLLMPFDGSNGAVTGPGFVDYSISAHVFAKLGSAQISTAQSVFGGSSLLLSAAGASSITTPDSADFDFGAGQFTVESRIRTTTVAAGSAFIVGQWFTAGTYGWVLSRNGSAINWNVSTDGTVNLTDLAGGTLSINTWYAVCVDYDGLKYRLYIDGAMVASSTTARTINNSTQPLEIGCNSGGGAFFWDGNIEEMRITKGVARYASDSGYALATATFPQLACGPCGESGHAAAFLARTSGLDTTHINAYTALLNGLETDGLTCKLDALYIFATQNSTTALLNLISSRYNASLIGAPTFTADRGFTGVDASSTVFVDTNFAPALAFIPNFTINSSHFSAWSVTDIGVSGFPVMGNSVSSFTECTLYPKFTDGNAYFRVDDSGALGGVAVADSKGHYIANRSTSSNVQGYKNGSSILTSTTDTALNLSSNSFYVLGMHSNITNRGSAHQVAMASLGASLSGTDATNFYNRLRTYMTAVGVP